LIDGAQAVPHMAVDVSKLGCDFYVFTGHKMLGPTGIGVLWAKKELLEKFPPFMGGGEMIKTVGFEKSTYEDIPLKFEAGTPNVAGAIGLASAIDYINAIGIDKIRKHEQYLTSYATEQLSQIPEIKIFGPGKNNLRSGVVSFNLSTEKGQAIHAHDVASILDSEGIAVRSGHHCAQPLMQVLGIPAAARASFYLYNTKEEVDKLIVSLNKVLNIFSKK
jgi:cysteine desulfurase/selenocysteine lyase